MISLQKSLLRDSLGLREGHCLDGGGSIPPPAPREENGLPKKL